MKKPHSTLLIAITLVFVAFTLGFFLGRSQNRSNVQISVPQKTPVSAAVLPATEATEPAQPSVTFPIDLNTATLEQLMALPDIGEVYARRILDYRTTLGQFSYVEQLLNVEGIGEKRLEAIYDLVTIGG